MAQQDFFALLIAGLDTKGSAKAINQQIKTDLAKSLKDVELAFELDSGAFKEIDAFLKGNVNNVELLKKEINELNKLTSQVSTKNLENLNNSRRDNIRTEAASKGLGEGNIVKEFYDPETKELTGAIIEVKNYRNEIEKLKVSFQDGVLQSTSLTAVSALSEELKENQKQIQHNTKAWKELETAQVKQGSNVDSAAQQSTLETDTLERYVQMIDAVTRAYERGELSQTSYQDQVAQIDAQLEKTTMELDKHSMKLADDSGFKQAKQALNDYKKDYNELLKLQLKEQTNPEGLTQAEREQLGILQQRIQGYEQLIGKYEVTKTQLAEIKTRADQAFKIDMADTEIDNINKDVVKLSKLYEELDKQKKKAFEGDLKNKPDVEAKKRVDDIEEEIRVRREALEVTRQTSDGQAAAVEALNGVQEKANSIAETRQRREAEANRTKEEVLSNTRGIILENEKFNTSAFKSGQAVDATTQEVKEFIKGIHGAKSSISDVTPATDAYGSALLKVTGVQDVGGDKVSEFTYYIDKQSGSVRQLSNELSNNVSRSMKFTEQITHAAKKMAIWGVAARALYGTMRMFKEGLTFIQDLDKDLTQAAIVTGKTRDEVKGLAQDYANLGIEMGKTVKEISKVNTELLRQGLSIQESSARLETIIKLSATGQISTEEALRVVTTAVNAMQESHEHAADVILKASNISASSVEQLGEAFTKAASSAFATGMEIEQVTGILATMLEVTQEGPSQLGTSLKTILARFNRVNEETGEWNDELNKVQQAIESVGIRFVNADGQIRNTYDILADLADIWPKMTKNQQAYIATTSAGVRMQNRFFAVMNNFERVKTITDATTKSAGTMNRAYLTYLDSVEAASNRTKASLEQLWINTLNSEAIKWFYDITAGLIRIVDQIGVLNAVLTITAAKLLLNKTLLVGLATASASLKGTTLAVTSLSGVLGAMGTAIQTSNKMSAILGRKTLPALTAALSSAASTGWSSIAFYVPWVAGIIAVVGAIALLVKGVQKSIEAQREHKQSLIDLNNTYLDNVQNQGYYRDELRSLGNEYEQFNKKIAASGLSADKALSTEEFQRFTEVQEKMLAIMPDLTTETDVYGNSVVVLTDGVSGLIEQYNEFIDITSQEFKDKHEEIMGSAMEDFDEYYKKLDSLRKEKATTATQTSYYDRDAGGVIEKTKEQMIEHEKIIDESIAEIQAKIAKGTTKALATWFAANQDGLGDFEASMLESGVIIAKAIEDGMDEVDLRNYLEELFNNGEFDVMNEVVDATGDSLKRINEEIAAGELPYKEYVKLMEEEIEAGKKLLILRLEELKILLSRAQARGEDTTAIQAEIDGINGIVQAWKNQIQVAAEAEESQNQFIMGQAKNFSEATDQLYKYQDLLTKLADGYYETKEIVDEVTKSYPELIRFLGDETELREEILRLINEEQITASEAYLQLMGDSKAYYEGARAELDALLAKAYGVRVADLKDAENFNHAKEIAENLFLKRILAAHKGLYDTLGQLRGKSLEQQLLEIAATKRLIGSSSGITGKGKETFDALSALEKDLKYAASVMATGLPKVSLPERTEALGGAADKAEELAEAAKLVVEEFAELNLELARIQESLDMLDIQEALLNEDDVLGAIRIIQERNTLLQEEYDIKQKIYNISKQQNDATADYLIGLGLLSDRNTLADNHLEVMEDLHSQYKYNEDAMSAIQDAFDNWYSATMNGLPDMRMGLEDLQKQIELNSREIQTMANEIEDAIMSRAYADYQNRAVRDVEARIRELTGDARDAERELESLKNRKDIIKERYDAEKEALEEKIAALDKIAEQEDDEAKRAELLLAIAKQREILANTKKNRSLQVLNEDNQWEWVADPREVKKEQDTLDNLISDHANWEIDFQRKKEKQLLQIQIDALTTEYNNDIAAQDRRIQTQEQALQRIQRNLERANDKLSDIQSRSYEEWLEEQEKWEEDFNVSTEDFLAIAEELYGEEFANMLRSVMGLAGGYDDLTDSIYDAIAAQAEMAGMKAAPPSGVNRTSSSSSSDSKNLATTQSGFSQDYSSQFAQAQSRGDAAGMAHANAMANVERGLGYKVTATNAIKAVDPKYKFADGGEIKSSGLYAAEFHGTKNDPEWIFNSKQLDTTMQRAITTALGLVIKAPNVTDASTVSSNSQTFNIDKLEFPNVKDAEEIKQAILNLPAMAKMKVRTS